LPTAQGNKGPSGCTPEPPLPSPPTPGGSDLVSTLPQPNNSRQARLAKVKELGVTRDFIGAVALEKAVHARLGSK
jgi:hypothetical protein